MATDMFEFMDHIIDDLWEDPNIDIITYKQELGDILRSWPTHSEFIANDLTLRAREMVIGNTNISTALSNIGSSGATFNSKDLSQWVDVVNKSFEFFKKVESLADMARNYELWINEV